MPRLSGTLAQRRSEIDFSLTDPYLFDRNLVGGVDIFHVAEQQPERFRATTNVVRASRYGSAMRSTSICGKPSPTTLVDRNVYDVTSDASLYIQNEAGGTLLSQIGQTLTLDYRDSRTDPHSGFVVRYGLDIAGLGGTAHYVRNKLDGTYYIPLERYTGDSDWSIAVSGAVPAISSRSIGRQFREPDRPVLPGG